MKTPQSQPGEPQPFEALAFSQTPAEPRIIEVVEVPSSVEILENLRSGADMVIARDSELQIVHDDIFGKPYTDLQHPLRTTYIVTSHELAEKMKRSGLFAAGWEIDDATYAPYIAFVQKNSGPLSSTYQTLSRVLGKNTRLDRSGSYVWEKNRQKLEKEDGRAIM